MSAIERCRSCHSSKGKFVDGPSGAQLFSPKSTYSNSADRTAQVAVRGIALRRYGRADNRKRHKQHEFRHQPRGEQPGPRAVTFTDAVRRLEAAFARPLPGVPAQERLAPRPRRQWPPGLNPARIRDAAGLLLLFPAGNEAAIVVTVRAEMLRHGGQVSLPGGVVDPGETFEQAALREAHEEIGLEREGVRMLGALTPLDIPISGFRLHPLVGSTTQRPSLHPADGEVARIVEIPIHDLLNPAHVVESQQQRDGRTLIVPAFHVADVEIWGATAMVLSEFLSLLGWKQI
jgi:8-oxo-dGTP pyrophosphatase MutT (NUDIX family)